MKCMKIFFSTNFFVLIFTSLFAFAYPDVAINNLTSEAFPGPAHHGLVLQTQGIQDSNLSHYEIQIKEDNASPMNPWYPYNDQMWVFKSSQINIPYRNGIFALKKNRTYCVRVRAIYGKEFSPWASQCGVTLTVPEVDTSLDSDEDGLLDNDEYLHGTDPNNPDSDGDGIDDATEVALGSDPNLGYLAELIIRTPHIDFGPGTPFGEIPTQHQYVEIENVGQDVAFLNSVTIVDGEIPGSALNFKVGEAPETIPAIPPQNVLRLPVSFLPTQRGPIEANLVIETLNLPEETEPVHLSGTGVGFPECIVHPIPQDPQNPDTLDFGTVGVNTEEVLAKNLFFSNIPPEEGDEFQDNVDTTWSFVLMSTVDKMAPAVRTFSLKRGESMEVPIFFQRDETGTYEGELTIQSMHCDTQIIHLRGTVQ